MLLLLLLDLVFSVRYSVVHDLVINVFQVFIHKRFLLHFLELLYKLDSLLEFQAVFVLGHDYRVLQRSVLVRELLQKDVLGEGVGVDLALQGEELHHGLPETFRHKESCIDRRLVAALQEFVHDDFSRTSEGIRILKINDSLLYLLCQLLVRLFICQDIEMVLRL